MLLLIKKNKKGFTLIETLISMAIFTFVSLALISVVMGFLKLNRLRNEVAIASSLAQAKIEEFKAKTNPGSTNINDYVLPATIIPSNDRTIQNIYKNIIIKVITTPVNNNISQNTINKLTVIGYKCFPCNTTNPTIKQTLVQYSTFISDN